MESNERPCPRARSLSARAFVIVACALASANGAFAIAACSSSSPSDEGLDATAETGPTGSDGGTDAPVTKPDATPQGDGGHCTAITGACDLVLQDCPNDSKGQKQECVVTGSGAAITTSCVPVQASQHLQKGQACCPPSQGAPDNPCLPGLTCVGNACVDGGPATGRCTPACCKGDDKSCGQSVPEGIAGACDITLVDTQSNTEISSVCSYRERCKPFGVEPCSKPGDVCLIEDKLGSASCLGSFGKQRGESCTFANECADGLMCVGSGDAGSCRYQCLIPGSNNPFDASVEEGGPGKGGCPAGEACNIGFDPKSAPAWLGACSDGG